MKNNSKKSRSFVTPQPAIAKAEARGYAAISGTLQLDWMDNPFSEHEKLTLHLAWNRGHDKAMFEGKGRMPSCWPPWWTDADIMRFERARTGDQGATHIRARLDTATPHRAGKQKRYFPDPKHSPVGVKP